MIDMSQGLVGTTPLHAATVALVLFALTVPIALRTAAREGRTWLVWLILGSLILHFLGSVLQVVVVRVVYDNSADFHLYNGQGRDLVEAWLSGHLTMPSRQIPGTGGVILLTALVYLVTGVDQIGGFFVFAWFSLLGLIAFYRAFRIALPDATDGRYAAMLFLLPSLWYWPTVAGKEAVMMPALGLMVLGSAQLMKRQWRGLAPLVSGGLLGSLVRPHEVALVFGAVAIAILVRRRPRRTLISPLQWATLFVFVSVSGVLVAWFTARYLGLSSLSSEAIVALVNDANENTQGAGVGYGSSHSEWNISPLYFPYDVVLVLFKPLPWEVGSFSQVIAAGENLSLLILLLLCWRALLTVPTALRRLPLVLAALVYSIAFIYLFSALANVGLLVRERTLLFPFLFVVLTWRSRAPDGPADGSPHLVGTTELLKSDLRPADHEGAGR